MDSELEVYYENFASDDPNIMTKKKKKKSKNKIIIAIIVSGIIIGIIIFFLTRKKKDDKDDKDDSKDDSKDCDDIPECKQIKVLFKQLYDELSKDEDEVKNSFGENGLWDLRKGLIAGVDADDIEKFNCTLNEITNSMKMNWANISTFLKKKIKEDAIIDEIIKNWDKTMDTTDKGESRKKSRIDLGKFPANFFKDTTLPYIKENFDSEVGSYDEFKQKATEITLWVGESTIDHHGAESYGGISIELLITYHIIDRDEDPPEFNTNPIYGLLKNNKRKDGGNPPLTKLNGKEAEIKTEIKKWIKTLK